MKSPARSVGSIEPDGMRKGSTMKERSSSTTTMTGKKDRDQSTYHGIGRGPPTPPAAARAGASFQTSRA